MQYLLTQEEYDTFSKAHEHNAEIKLNSAKDKFIKTIEEIVRANKISSRDIHIFSPQAKLILDATKKALDEFEL